MNMTQYSAFVHVKANALRAFETPVPPFQFARPSDLFLTVQPHYAQEWHGWHIWSDPQQRITATTQIVWERSFDSRRFRDPKMGRRYGWKKTPTLETFYHAPAYDALWQRVDAILGAIPLDIRQEQQDSTPESTRFGLVLRLPLSELTLEWQNNRWGALSQACHDLHEWLISTPHI